MNTRKTTHAWIVEYLLKHKLVFARELPKKYFSHFHVDLSCGEYSSLEQYLHSLFPQADVETHNIKLFYDPGLCLQPDDRRVTTVVEGYRGAKSFICEYKRGR